MHTPATSLLAVSRTMPVAVHTTNFATPTPSSSQAPPRSLYSFERCEYSTRAFLLHADLPQAEVRLLDPGTAKGTSEVVMIAKAAHCRLSFP